MPSGTHSLRNSYGAHARRLYQNALPEVSHRFWSVGPSVSVPVFQGGALFYGRKAAIQAHQTSQANYREAVLAASRKWRTF